MTKQSSNQSQASLHTISVLVENLPGVLARVTSLFARRAFNIDSLSVSPTEKHNISRLTVTAHIESLPLSQLKNQLNKLLHVLKVDELEPETLAEREIALIKLSVSAAERSAVLEIVRMFHARVIDVDNDYMTIEAADQHYRIDSLLVLLEDFSIIEFIRSGSIALSRTNEAFTKGIAE